MRRRWLACAALAAARSPWEASQDAAQCARLGDAAGACAAAQVGLHGARVARGGAPVFVDLGRKREIQDRFNMSVPRARVPEKASMLRDRSER